MTGFMGILSEQNLEEKVERQDTRVHGGDEDGDRTQRQYLREDNHPGQIEGCSTEGWA
ncbi:hypothetical protein [Aquicoccus porphyridii]|uniref:hypothetical protein n=1 Tax=Aquicoccus porphyridii TaxID=1852029 RepID=UPI00165EAE42|nr:hypothetical protein [Aquicoccus porphyridii]